MKKSFVALTNTTSNRIAKTTIKKSTDNRYTLDRWTLYLDSCTTYHYFFAKEVLTNINRNPAVGAYMRQIQKKNVTNRYIIIS